MEDAVYHAMKDRRKQLERSRESCHSAHTHTHTHTHNTRMHAHTHTHTHSTRMHAHKVYNETSHTVRSTC